MKKSERDELQKAFGIPEPQRKEDFLSERQRLINTKKRRRMLPILLRTAAAAAVVALAVGICGKLGSLEDIENQFHGSGIITGTEPTEHTASSDTITIITTSAASTTAGFTSTASSDTITNQTTSAPKASTTVGITSATASAQVTTTAATSPAAQTGTQTTSAAVSSPVSTSAPEKTTASATASNIVTSSTTKVVVEITTTSTNGRPGNIASGNGKDLTITPEVTYTGDGDIYNIDYFSKLLGGPPTGSMPGDEPSSGYMLMKEYAGSSEMIISARIDSIIYTQRHGSLFTQENVTITDVFRQRTGIGASDMISIYLNGGYIPSEEYLKLHPEYSKVMPEGITIYDKGGNKGVQKEGETYLFFLRRDPRFSSGYAFSTVTQNDNSVFVYKNGVYRSIFDESIYFTPKELESFLNKR